MPDNPATSVVVGISLQELKLGNGVILLCQALFIIYIHRCDLKYNLNKTKFLSSLHRILTLAYTGVKEVKVMAIQ